MKTVLTYPRAQTTITALNAESAPAVAEAADWERPRVRSRRASKLPPISRPLVKTKPEEKAAEPMSEATVPVPEMTEPAPASAPEKTAQSAPNLNSICVGQGPQDDCVSLLSMSAKPNKSSEPTKFP